MNKWQKIWNKSDRVEKIILETLIKADGFDSGAGSFSVDDWLVYSAELLLHLNMSEQESIYDVGCGSGAFIYPLYLKEHNVGGLDYSTVLVQLANTIMTNRDFSVKEAIKLDTFTKYDVVLSHSVFQYFNDLYYAKEVLVRMIEKSNQKIAIFDINDKLKENEYHKIRMGDMSSSVYKKKYSGLNHMFYEKTWFEEIAKEYNLKINIFDQTYTQYTNSTLRFNVIMEKC